MTAKPMNGLGVISLASVNGSLFRRSILCHIGVFDGVYGQCVVTEQLLNGLADRYNKQRANVQNVNDYAPILKDHDRKVDNVYGRIMADLSVEDWTDPETGEVLKALFGSLRVDDDDAKQKVLAGKYSQLSISFDEETFEIFEVSFVAVEAARRSQLLGHGGKNKMDVALKLESLQKKHTSLKTKLGLVKKRNTEAGVSLSKEVKLAFGEVKDLSESIQKVTQQFKTAIVLGQLRGFIAEGKMTKAEFDKINAQELSTLPKSALSALITSYDGRKPSSDMFQHGQSGGEAAGIGKINLAGAEMRSAMKAQKEGKSFKSLAGDPDPERKDGEGATSSMDMKGFDDALKALEDLPGHMDKLKEYQTKFSEALKKLQGPDSDDSSEGDDGDDE